MDRQLTFFFPGDYEPSGRQQDSIGVQCIYWWLHYAIFITFVVITYICDNMFKKKAHLRDLDCEHVGAFCDHFYL